MEGNGNCPKTPLIVTLKILGRASWMGTIMEFVHPQEHSALLVNLSGPLLKWDGCLSSLRSPAVRAVWNVVTSFPGHPNQFPHANHWQPLSFIHPHGWKRVPFFLGVSPVSQAITLRSWKFSLLYPKRWTCLLLKFWLNQWEIWEV